ncbi:MAG: hypothetical protein M1819_005360 [Sarea resinae]|nr:MAG: hypothetical protein M1819_005360 [Sarea resinae]
MELEYPQTTSSASAGSFCRNGAEDQMGLSLAIDSLIADTRMDVEMSYVFGGLIMGEAQRCDMSNGDPSYELDQNLREMAISQVHHERDEHLSLKESNKLREWVGNKKDKTGRKRTDAPRTETKAGKIKRSALPKSGMATTLRTRVLQEGSGRGRGRILGEQNRITKLRPQDLNKAIKARAMKKAGQV